MKKLLCVSVVLLLALVLAACAQLAPTPEPLPETKPKTVGPPFTEPTFYLSALPQLPPHEPPSGIVARYLPEQFVHTLKAGEDYGRLFPYMVKVYDTNPRGDYGEYGLADAQGRVVVPPVYRSAYYTDPEHNGGQVYLVLSYPVDTTDYAAKILLNDTNGSVRQGWHVVAKADGSWVSDFIYGDNVYVYENHIIATTRSSDLLTMGSIIDPTYHIYDMQGKLIAEGNGRLEDFHDGRAALAYGEDACYLDINGQVAIPGPFKYANNFQNGRAVVAVGKSWNNCLFAVINTQGEYITPAIFEWFELPYEESATMAVASKEDNSYWLINLLTGDTRQIEIGNANINNASICANNWCLVSYKGGAALLKGKQLYRFDEEPGSNVDCRPLRGELFAISYWKYDEQGRAKYHMDIFDVTEGRVVASLPNFNFSHIINDKLIIVNTWNRRDMWAYNLDYTPAFNGEFTESILHNIKWVGDDEYNLYSVLTSQYSGLINPNGEWLLRVDLDIIDTSDNMIFRSEN